MQFLRGYVAWMRLGSEYTQNHYGVDTRDERGALSTEMAVLISVFVAIAVAGGVIFIAKMRSNANNIPDTVSPPG
jgi:hypothetical protein